MATTTKSADSGQSMLISANDAAKLIGMGVGTIRRLTDSGKMPGVVRIGRTVRYKKSDVERWIQDGCPETVKGNR